MSGLKSTATSGSTFRPRRARTRWINQEFHLDLQRFDPATGRVAGIPIPRPPMPGPFALSLLGADIQTQISGAGEDILIDPSGRVWFTQGGGYLYNGKHPNHSRIVSYDPMAPEKKRFRVYTAASLGFVTPDWSEVVRLPPLASYPGDGNAAATGLAIDPSTCDIWFCEFWRRRIGHLHLID
jgi:hypothetical protein